jgi:hypothetical protein
MDSDGGGGVMRFFFLSAGHNAFFLLSARHSEFNFESAGNANLFECSSSTEGAF